MRQRGLTEGLLQGGKEKRGGRGVRGERSRSKRAAGKRKVGGREESDMGEKSRRRAGTRAVGPVARGPLMPSTMALRQSSASAGLAAFSTSSSANGREREFDEKAYELA